MVAINLIHPPREVVGILTEYLPDLDALVDPETRGDPESPLRWTCKSARKLAAALREKSHFPPGASNWNKIEHRLFSFITMNWRGRPLVSHEGARGL